MRIHSGITEADGLAANLWIGQPLQLPWPGMTFLGGLAGAFGRRCRFGWRRMGLSATGMTIQWLL